jgi:hypothetical protein
MNPVIPRIHERLFLRDVERQRKLLFDTLVASVVANLGKEETTLNVPKLPHKVGTSGPIFEIYQLPKLTFGERVLSDGPIVVPLVEKPEDEPVMPNRQQCGEDERVLIAYPRNERAGLHLLHEFGLLGSG